MSKKRTPKGTYEVGYAKPPQHSRFRPGESGNRRGRPKGEKNLSTYLLEEAGSMIVVSNGDTSVTIPKAQALVKTAMNKGLRGDMRAIIWLATQIHAAQQGVPVDSELNEEDTAILEAFLQRYGGRA